MKTIALFDITSYKKNIISYVVLVILFSFGIFAGNQFNLTFGEGVFLNSPYTIGFMLGFLSLSIIFIATIIGSQLLFREDDSRFNLIIYTTPISEKHFFFGRFISFFSLTFLLFTFLFMGFVLGQSMRIGDEMKPGFHLVHYLFPYIVFGFVNSFLVCSFLYFFSILLKQKMALVVSGLLLYIIYMVALLFSHSPIMNNRIPQSEISQKLSTLLDIFGLSAYIFESKNFSVSQRNSILVPLSGYFLLNRILVLIISLLLLWLANRKFSFCIKSSKNYKNKVNENSNIEIKVSNQSIKKIIPEYHLKSSFLSIISFLKLDSNHIFKSIAFVGSLLLLVFSVGMEMFSEIEKNIRMPNKYASSGLMANTIIENFHFLGIILIAYFANELFWRSKSSRFSLIETTSYYSFNKLIGHWLSITLLIMVYSLFLIAEGIIFQFIYHYPFINSRAYFGVFAFNILPMVLFGGFVLLINLFIRNKYIALGISIATGILLSTSVVKKIFEIPLLRFFLGFTGEWSDFNGFGIYIYSFSERTLFGFSIILMAWLLYYFFTNKSLRNLKVLFVCIMLLTSFFSGKSFMKGYNQKNEEYENQQSVQYEKQFKAYEKLPQPTIKYVKTDIQLYPENRKYTVTGVYGLKNISGKPIKKILVNLDKNTKIKKAILKFKNHHYTITQNVTEVILKSEMLPEELAKMEFEITYKWFPVNGHQSFNSILENGSFSRISRYFPIFGYQQDYEISDVNERKKWGLKTQSSIKKLESPKINSEDFIDLEMTISTSGNQTVAGTGDLMKSWKKDNRNYFQFFAKQIPFRFGLSSAIYEIQKSNYKGIQIQVLYHSKHSENVKRLIDNTKMTYDYCIQNFGKYPFKTITFAEISSFTKGFNATAYPATIFMVEDKAFHADLTKQKNQDVINELAGHELSHFWWGGNQISPDDREGAPMLTETLAMYTEMMIYKKMHGKEKMLDRLKFHQQIYDEGKGFSQPQPLYKVTSENVHISYSKGAIIMVKLSELISEKRLNNILKDFISKYKYPQKPTTLDFLNHLYKNLNSNERIKVQPWFQEP